MSIDYKLFNLCDHYMIEEELVISGLTATLKYTSNKSLNQMVVFRKYWGTEIVGWTLGADAKTITFVSGSIITDTTIYPQPIYLCNYTANQIFCPKCQGSSVMKDMKYSSSGLIDEVADAEKLKQYLKKAIITTIESNSFHEDYGTYLSSLIGYRITPQMIVKMNFTIDQMGDSLKGYQNDSFNLNDKEIIYSISNIKIEQTDERTLGVNITVTNKEYVEIETYIEVLL